MRRYKFSYQPGNLNCIYTKCTTYEPIIILLYNSGFLTILVTQMYK